MIKCKVFRTDWGSTTILGPADHFNKFCEENPNIEVIKIDTLNVGINNGDVQIFLYYKEPETTYSTCAGNNTSSDFEEITVRNFKPGDKIKYFGADKAYYGTIIKTGNSSCLIRLDSTHEVIEVNYRYIFKQEKD